MGGSTGIFFFLAWMVADRLAGQGCNIGWRSKGPGLAAKPRRSRVEDG